MSDVRKHTHLGDGRRFLVVINDLLWEPVDAIVNAANGHLAHGGGVAAAISAAAGEELDSEGRAYVGTEMDTPYLPRP